MKRFILPISAIVLLVATSGAAVYFYRKASSITADPTAKVQQETDSLVASVGKLILLPQGETPTIATVSDPAKLKDQPFFANAKSGDKVLLYQNAKKVYLYDPVANKIVEVAPINVSSNPPVNSGDQTQTTTTPVPEPTQQSPAPTTPKTTPKTTKSTTNTIKR